MDKLALSKLAAVAESAGNESESTTTDSRGSRDSFVGFHVDDVTKRQITAIAEAEGVSLASYLRDIVALEILRAARGEGSLREIWRKEQRKFLSSRLTDVTSVEKG